MFSVLHTFPLIAFNCGGTTHSFLCPSGKSRAGPISVSEEKHVPIRRSHPSDLSDWLRGGPIRAAEFQDFCGNRRKGSSLLVGVAERIRWEARGAAGILPAEEGHLLVDGAHPGNQSQKTEGAKRVTSPAPHPQLCRKPALPLAFSSLNQRVPLSSVSRWFHFALYVSKQNTHCFQRMPMTVSPSPAMPSSAPLVSLLWSGSLSLEVILRVSFAPGAWLALLQPWGSLAVALHRPADAWNLWSGTLCYSTFAIIRTLLFCLRWCRRNAKQHAGLTSPGHIHQPECVRAAGLQLPFLAYGSGPQFHRVTDTHHVNL